MGTSTILIPAVCLLLGSYLLIRNARLLMNEQQLLDYLDSSVKGKAWIARFGRERTVFLSKRLFIPAGCILSLVMLGVGIRNLILII